ncbi:MAG: TonB-dependent receptor [Acidobacteriota bacterium]
MKYKNMSRFVLLAIAILSLPLLTLAQSLGTAGTITGTVTDPNNAVVSGATVTISNSVTGFLRTTTTDSAGAYRFIDVPFNNFTVRTEANGFRTTAQGISVRSSVPISMPIALTLGDATATVNVTADTNIVEDIPTPRTQVDQTQIRRLPLNTPGNGLSDVVTYASPGVVADSNGFFHPLGDHAQSQISLDGQPIADQQSKAFSTQIPVNAIQSLDIITGATPAEFGDKTSLVINAITKSGLNQRRATGSFYQTFGSFRTIQDEADVAFGNDRVGNFAAFNFERSRRFLDAPEFVSLHNRGTSGSFFDRLDYSPSTTNVFHLNLFYARNNFQTANTYEQQDLGQDQRQKVETFNIAPGFVHVFNASTVLTINPYYRQDQVNYFPSANPFSDQTTTISQSRRLANYGFRADVSYVKGINNIKVGGQIQRTRLREGFAFGITDSGFNPLCFDANGNPVEGTVCNGTTTANDNFLPGLLPFDLTRGGSQFAFNGSTTIKQEAAYIQDALNFKNGLTVSLGLRYDNYRGLSKGRSLQPRLGVSYLVKRTKTVLRASYTRNFETPYNENLILSSSTGGNGLADGIFGDTSATPLKPGYRNQFNFGIQQGFGRYVVADFDYFDKRTRNAYDFNVILNTPITFPISWDRSKLNGYSFKVNLTNYKGLSAFYTGGHTRALFFPPESGGLFFNADLPTGPFLIDHDQKFQQTAQVQYGFDQFRSFRRFAPYVAFTYRYDSGLVSGAVGDYDTALGFTADEQQQIGLFCGSQVATLANPIRSCDNADRGALRARFPVGVASDDKNPPRIAPRNLFDLNFGSDNILGTERVRLTGRFSIVNIGNKVALYNFESTFSGTHFVTPRAFQGQVGITF